jgi:hypothetical protein
VLGGGAAGEGLRGLPGRIWGKKAMMAGATVITLARTRVRRRDIMTFSRTLTAPA